MFRLKDLKYFFVIFEKAESNKSKKLVLKLIWFYSSTVVLKIYVW